MERSVGSKDLRQALGARTGSGARAPRAGFGPRDREGRHP